GIALKDGALRIGAGVRQRDIETSPDVARHVPLLARAVSFVAHAAIRNRGTIGGNLAHADPASELPACMVALGARMNIVGPGGNRAATADSFFRGIYETDLKPGEILTSVDVPVMPSGRRAWFDELARRRGDYAMVGLVAVADKSLVDARFVFFAVADRPILAVAAAKAAAGQTGEAAVKASREALTHDLNPAGDLHTSGPTKMHLARVLIGRAIAELTK
ncbi:MAG: xanthine dehydrogenase family protein subunit M, partial [Alphaproteobacteria bacterium]|nr:xanthine dehydrogenase family protein subunit M [Alphaproteobacteria bacterium]